MFHAVVNANSIMQHVIRIKNGIIKYVYVSVKTIISAKNIIVRILTNVFVKMTNVQKVWISNYV